MRLSRETVNQAYRMADHERWTQQDFIVGIKVSLSAQHPLPDICDDCQGTYPKSFVFPGWHVQCMCHATPVLMPQYHLKRQLAGETVEVQPITDTPKNFDKWIRDNEERMKGWKSEPYFIKYNKEFVNQIINK